MTEIVKTKELSGAAVKTTIVKVKPETKEAKRASDSVPQKEDPYFKVESRVLTCC